MRFPWVSSVSRRLLLSVMLPLLLFFGVTVAALDAVFRDLSRRSMIELLDAQLVALIAASDIDARGSIVPQLEDAESRLATHGSGLYAQIRTLEAVMWRSPSAEGGEIDFGPALAPGTRTLESPSGSGEPLAVLSRGLRWEEARRRSQDLTFSVATSLQPYEAQLGRFRRQLLGWFAGLTVLLLGTLALLTRVALSPLRRLERQIHAVEAGELELLTLDYPRELAGITTNLNALLTSERARISRYRDTLGNLAHSLKTPLAVIRSTLSERAGASASPAIEPQLERMTAIIDHQLKRASTSGRLTVGHAPVSLAPIVRELRATLLKVHARKDMAIEVRVPEDAHFIGDPADITEVLGNLMDNACKWCESLVRVSAGTVAAEAGDRPLALDLQIEDDGPGIPAGERARVLERGVRADERVPGHGLGLAMVIDTVELYGGRMDLGESPLGGARVGLRLPGRVGRAAA